MPLEKPNDWTERKWIEKKQGRMGEEEWNMELNAPH